QSGKPDKVQIAAEGPFTGDEASIGAGALQAIQLAVEDFNKAGGVNGTQVSLLVWDDQHSAQTAATLQAQGISDPTVLGVVGPMNSGVVLGTLQGLQGANPPLPMVSESASNVTITNQNFGADWVYFADEGPEVAPLVQQLKAVGLTIPDKINFLGSDGTEDPSIISASQGAYLSAYSTNVTASPIGVDTAASFVTRFKSKYGADSVSKAGPFVGSAYEATQVLLQAIKASPVNNGK